MNVEDSGRWQGEADIVVVGGGGCGLTAAIAAAREGAPGRARVRVLEKLAETRGNTGRSGGMIPAAGTRFQRAAGVTESAESFAEDILEKNRHGSDPQTTLHLCRTSKALVEWLVDEVGIDLVFIDDFKYPGHREYRMHAPPSRTGAALMADLRRAADAEPGVELTTGSGASGLVVSGGAVRGVVTGLGADEIRIRAGRVILASNGFAGNRAMVERYCPEVSGARYAGGEGNTGEGIVWGRDLGGALAFMDAFQAHASLAVPPGASDGVLITYSLIMEGGVQVNARGERFGDESSGYSAHALAVLAQPGGEVWDVFDERLHRLGLKFDDYRAAQALGIVRRSETLGGLAAAIDVDAEALHATLDAYHAAAEGRAADPFGRADARRLEPPYYAVKVTGALFHTQGGLVVDRDGRVLREDGSPIPNLYAGGGVAAGISGHGPAGYLSGNGLLTALGYGLLAGRHAARARRGGGVR